VIRDVDASVTFSRPRSLASILDAQLGTRRITTDVVSGFAGLAVGLAALGLYGLLLVAVTARSKDFGVRLALGAAPWALARGVIGESLRDAGIGIALGLVLASIAGGLIRALLVDVAPGDPLTLAGVGAVLIFVAAASAVVPARRAAAVDPVRVLRGE
jgi:ABC-type antimicrobial peptide transport system permease subunit